MDQAGETRAALATYADLAKRLDHALVQPDLTDDEVGEGVRLALEYDVACVSVRPSDLAFTVRQTEGSGVAPGSVVGFPHGSSTTASKLYEMRDLIRRGAKELDVVLNIGKLRSRQFQYVETELLQMGRACHESGVLFKVILENAYLTEDLKIIALKICKRCEADFVKTSTGFAPAGWAADDVRLMVRILKGEAKVKAAGGIHSLATALEAYEAGAERLGTTRTALILDEWKARLLAEAENAASPST